MAFAYRPRGRGLFLKILPRQKHRPGRLQKIQEGYTEHQAAAALDCISLRRAERDIRHGCGPSIHGSRCGNVDREYKLAVSPLRR